MNFFSWSSSSSSDKDGQERFLNQGRCRTHCPRGLYPDRGHYECLPCIANCELCTDGNICAKCQERYKLQNGVCQTVSCSTGKYCKSLLLNWLRPERCHSERLMDFCVPGQVQDPDTGECIDCEAGCSTCSTGRFHVDPVSSVIRCQQCNNKGLVLCILMSHLVSVCAQKTRRSATAVLKVTSCEYLSSALIVSLCCIIKRLSLTILEGLSGNITITEN